MNYNKFLVEKYDYNRRLDNWIFSYFKNIPKSIIYKMIRKGKILVNNKKKKFYYKLKINDYIITSLNINKKLYNYNYNYFTNKNIDDYILYEDNYLFIINKPSGISVHGGSKINYDIISSLRQIYSEKYELTHRLDKYTSGILIIAKNKYILRLINEKFTNREIKKKYIILVHGVWNKNINEISLPIKKKVFNNKSINVFDKNGKKSLSLFKIIKIFKNLTLLEVTPITGRNHQIRIQTSYFGFPIVFDNIYGNKILDSKISFLNLNRMFLHSNMVKFYHPINKKLICIKSNISNDLLTALEKLKNY